MEGHGAPESSGAVESHGAAESRRVPICKQLRWGFGQGGGPVLFGASVLKLTHRMHGSSSFFLLRGFCLAMTPLRGVDAIQPPSLTNSFFGWLHPRGGYASHNVLIPSIVSGSVASCENSWTPPFGVVLRCPTALSSRQFSSMV